MPTAVAACQEWATEHGPLAGPGGPGPASRFLTGG